MEVANEQGCSGCHTTDGTVLVGPSRMGLFGRDEELEDGTAVTVDAAYIEESIKDPAARITKGFTNT
jgi:cytochrome c oxidase subunit 2